MKITERTKSIELRKKGLTYPEIAEQLFVSRSSLSLWLRDIPYVPTQETRYKRRLASINTGRLLHQRKLKRTSRIKWEARREIYNLNSDELKLLGIMAYWAEGSKTKDSLVQFVNTDPKLIKLALRWLRESCDVPERKIRCHLRVHPDTDRKKAEDYWSKVTKIPKERFSKTTIKISGSGGRGYNKISNGIASVRVCDTNLFYKIRGWIEGLIDNACL